MFSTMGFYVPKFIACDPLKKYSSIPYIMALGSEEGLRTTATGFAGGRPYQTTRSPFFATSAAALAAAAASSLAILVFIFSSLSFSY